MTIRQATLDDQPRMVAMGLRFLAETAYKQFPSTPGRLGWILEVILEHGAAFVAEQDGALTGMIAGILHPHYLSGEPYVEEIVWWVEPQHRRGTIGLRLLAALEHWTVTKGVHVLTMVAPADSLAGLFYERRGYVALETAYVKRL